MGEQKPKGAPPFILFADDDEDTLELFKVHIQSRGWNGDYARDVFQILDRVNENCCTEGRGCYDVIVADVNYLNANDVGGPSITGITAAREIRKVHEDVPIIFLTGYDNPLIRQEIKRVHGIHMKKPVDPDELFNKLISLTSWHRENHKDHDGKGHVPTDGNADWTIRDIHQSEGGTKLSVPPRLYDTFVKASLDAIRRPRLVLNNL